MTNKQQKPLNQGRTPQQNNPLRLLRKKVVVQALIAIQTVIITIALIFGMSAAWYTNVLQTSGLQFEAASWGFTGEVTVTNEPIEAAPGDDGVIGLSVTNQGEDMVDVAVHVSKEQMAEPMSQRLYFYVDTVDSRNGELMERVYINTRDSYTYSVLSYGELVLSKERSNDVFLKWQWVYDVLGYYFLGTVTETSSAEDTKVVVQDVEDYLRPVEYDLDKAVFEEGLLESVDGLTVEEFVDQLAATDGYENDPVPTDMPGYYMIDVDEDGYGIWMYLCDWAQIQQATLYDSKLGENAANAIDQGTAREKYVARLTVVGQMTQAEYMDVTTVEQLVEQLNTGAMLQLQQNLVLDEPITVGNGAKSVLDLNGHTITGPENSELMKLTDSANVTIINGKIIAQDATKDVISVSGSNLTMHNVSISGDGDDAVDISDENGMDDSCVRLFGCEIDVEGCAVYLRGNGDKSRTKTQLIIEKCTLKSNYITIMGNGTDDYWGTDIQIYQTTLEGKYAAIYQPQSDSLTRLTESKATGMCGIVIKGGDLDIVSGTIQGTGESKEPQIEGSGYTDTGDAVYVDCGYSVPIRVTISGNSEVISDKAYPIRVFEPYGDYGSVIITGGTFSSDVSGFVADGYMYDQSTESVIPIPQEEGAGNG